MRGELTGGGGRWDGEGGVAVVHTGNSEGVVFANDIVPALLVVHCQVGIGQVDVGQMLAAGDSSTLKHREGEASKPARMYLVGSQAHGGTE